VKTQKNVVLKRFSATAERHIVHFNLCSLVRICKNQGIPYQEGNYLSSSRKGQKNCVNSTIQRHFTINPVLLTFSWRREIIIVLIRTSLIFTTANKNTHIKIYDISLSCSWKSLQHYILRFLHIQSSIISLLRHTHLCFQHFINI
jgi:hypothetical protein